MSITGFGARALIPDELLEGFGYDAVSDTWLIRPAIPLAGTVDDNYADAWQTRILVHWGFYITHGAFLKEQVNRIMIWQSAYDAIINGIGRVGDVAFPNPNFVFRWRPRGSPDGTSWTEIPGQYLAVSLASGDTPPTSGTREIIAVMIEDRRLNPSDPDYDAGTSALPVDDAEIEFFLIGPMPPDENHPIIVDGMTAGEFTVNAYAGMYSERDPDTGAIMPTGVRYDSVAVLQMTAPVMFLLTEHIKDLRDWLEKHIYQPHGFCPRLDDDARISPVSQIAPVDTLALTTITNAVLEATPDWTAGGTVINTIRFVYPRFYASDPPDPPPRFDGIPRQNVLEFINVEALFVDPLSVARFGEKTLEIKGLAFGAIGVEPPDELVVPPSRSRVVGRGPGRSNRPVTDQIVVVPGRHIQPLTGDIADETGYQLALDRYEHVLNRYAYGAPTVRFPVTRSAIDDERVGDWVWLNISHYPDYVTQRRGLSALAQIVALKEISCPWRHVVCEVVRPLDES